MEEIIKGFVSETLKGLNEIIGICNSNPKSLDKRDAEKVFFVMHSLTGSSAMFGFGTIAQYSLYAERVYDKVRKGELIITPQVIEYTINISQAIKEIILKEDNGILKLEIIDFFKDQLDK